MPTPLTQNFIQNGKWMQNECKWCKMLWRPNSVLTMPWYSMIPWSWAFQDSPTGVLWCGSGPSITYKAMQTYGCMFQEPFPCQKHSKTQNGQWRSFSSLLFPSVSWAYHQTIMVSTLHASENNSWVSWSNSIKVVAFSEKTRWPRRKLLKETNLGIVHKDPESFTILFLEISWIIHLSSAPRTVRMPSRAGTKRVAWEKLHQREHGCW